ncbi:MAG: hypothetical protein ACW967_04360 [Candidatus Hodarchaeales archaeon]|jgi:hypothetical protein
MEDYTPKLKKNKELILEFYLSLNEERFSDIEPFIGEKIDYGPKEEMKEGSKSELIEDLKKQSSDFKSFYEIVDLISENDAAIAIIKRIISIRKEFHEISIDFKYKPGMKLINNNVSRFQIKNGKIIKWELVISDYLGYLLQSGMLPLKKEQQEELKRYIASLKESGFLK